MTEVDLIKALLGGGTIAAFIVIVIVFLRQQQRIDLRADNLTSMFAAQFEDFKQDVSSQHETDCGDQGTGWGGKGSGDAIAVEEACTEG
jgi:hypothetical protein